MSSHAKSKPWRVVRQTSSTGDAAVSQHRFGWLAELAASRRERRDRSSATALGVFYTAYHRNDGLGLAVLPTGGEDR